MELLNNHKSYTEHNKLAYSCQYHIIFCPKFRRKVLINGIDNRIKELVAGLQLDYKFTLIDIEVMSDHVHMILDINPRIGVYSTMTKIKGYLSHNLREEFPELKSKLPCLWS